jgi:hypothetical protein
LATSTVAQPDITYGQLAGHHLQYGGSAFDDWVQLAWVGALPITFGVLAIDIAARSLLRGGGRIL